MPALTTVGEPAVVDSTSRNVLFSAGGILWNLQGYSCDLGTWVGQVDFTIITNVTIFSFMQLASQVTQVMTHSQ